MSNTCEVPIVFNTCEVPERFAATTSNWIECGAFKD